MQALRKLLNKPKLEEGSLLSLFYFCDVAVNTQMEELNRLMRSNPDNLDRRSTLITHLKESQHNLMTVIMNIMDEAIPNRRASRDFRAKYPDDVLLDQISGPIWFGAECIAAGSHIANHELESIELRPYAIHISKIVSKVRSALREQCFLNRAVYTQRLKDLLQSFDELWADFEFRYVGLMCNVKSEMQYLHQQDVVVLFCESTLRAIKQKYLTYSMIEMMDPSVMFAIPRLAIFCGLVVYPDGPLNPSRPQKDMPPCFRAYRQLLCRIKELLGHLNEQQLATLEKALCSAEGLGTLKRNAAKKSQKKQEASPDCPTEEVGSETGTDEAAPSLLVQSYNLDSRDTTNTVFEPTPVASEQDKEPHTEGAHAGMLVTEETPFPQLGDREPIPNDLPSSSNPLPTLESASVSQLAVQGASSPSAKGKSSKRKHSGPAGFPTAEDLMHRLFLGISGVADQLQTNHARDLRVILKHVFTVCQEPDEEEEYKGMNHREECVGGQPCTPEPESPLITASQRFSFTVGSVSNERRPSWVPDSDAANCSGCRVRFSWRKRRHHCRSCGKIVCSRCSRHNLPLPQFGITKPVRVCTGCYISKLGEVSRQIVPLSQSMHVH